MSLAAVADRDDELDLVVQVLGQGRIRHAADLALGDRQHRVGRLHEEERRLAAGEAHLLRVLDVVAADAVDAVDREGLAARAGDGNDAAGGGCEDMAHGRCFRCEDGSNSLRPERGGVGDDDAMRHPTLAPCSRPAASSTVAPAAARCATRRRPTTTAIAPPASSARRSTTRTRSTSSARCRSGTTRCCSAGATSSRATACGRCRPASWSSARRPRKARCARPIEEAGARVELEGLYSLINVVRVGQVHLFYRARLLDTDFAPGPESIEAKLFVEDEIPWDEIAFRTDRDDAEYYFDDRRQGRFASTAPTSRARKRSSFR